MAREGKSALAAFEEAGFEGAEAEALLFTCGEEPPPGESGGLRLHAVFLGRIFGIGAFFCFWLSDPRSELASLSIEDPRKAPLDLLSGAAPLPLATLGEAVPFSPPPAGSKAYLRFIGESALSSPSSPILLWRLKSGAGGKAVIKAKARPAELYRILALSPLADAILLCAESFDAWRQGNEGALEAPPQLERIFRLLQRRIPGESGRIDAVLPVAEKGFLLCGALGAKEGDPFREISLKSLSGRSLRLDLPLPAARPFGGERQTVRKALPGERVFALFAPFEKLHPAERFWFLEAIAESGKVSRLAFTLPDERPPRETIRAAVLLAEPGVGDCAELFRRAISPVVDPLWQEMRRRPGAPREIAYGEGPARPQVSIVVPLFARIDLLHHQIARFANDPEMKGAEALAEILYVLDDPPLEGPLRELCDRVHAIYGLSFRSLVGERNLGFSGACNLGAAAASGPLILFLNSDVLPKGARWLGRLVKTYRSLERCGILGCRLLLEDGAIAHAGMNFRLSPVLPEAWENEHPGKGLPAAFDLHPQSARVPAVTAAALLIEQRLYRDLGGLSEDYVFGDFEDSDLCLKAYLKGWHTYYTPEVELHHLERQSMKRIADADWRYRLTLYNMWKHGRKWGETIPRLLESLGEGGASEAGREPAPKAAKGRRGN